MIAYNSNLKRAKIVLLSLFLSATLTGIDTGSARSQNADNSEARQLFQRMLNADSTLSFSGTQATILLIKGHELTSQQIVMHNGNRAFRMEYLQPEKLKGELIIDDGREFWHYIPAAHKLDVGPSRAHRMRMRIPQVLKQVEQGSLHLQQVGQETLAGHPCVIIDVTPTAASEHARHRRFWIDPTTGTQLGIAGYDAQGQRTSFSYFTSVDYNPTFDKAAFAAPEVPANVTIEAIQNGKSFSSIAEAQTQAGFPIVQPLYVPSSFHFQSASISDMHDNKVVGLRYVNGINVISLFETPSRNRDGRDEDHGHNRNDGHGYNRNDWHGYNRGDQDKIYQPHTGVYMTKRAGLRIILIGNLSPSEMERILSSLPL